MKFRNGPGVGILAIDVAGIYNKRFRVKDFLLRCVFTRDLTKYERDCLESLKAMSKGKTVQLGPTTRLTKVQRNQLEARRSGPDKR